MKPRRAKPVDREGPVQKSIVEFLEKSQPKWLVHHCKTEINKGGLAFMKEAARAKSLGAKAGFPDLLVLPFGNIGPLFFEVKAPKNYPTDAQYEMHERLRALGYRVAVVRSIDDVQDKLHEWGIVAKIPENSGA